MAAILAAAALVSCAAEPRYAWHKPGVSQSGFWWDSYVCARESRSAAYPAPPPAPGGRWDWSGAFFAEERWPGGIGEALAVSRDLYVACMQARGYELRALK
jgi:hypothetical protein